MTAVHGLRVSPDVVSTGQSKSVWLSASCTIADQTVLPLKLYVKRVTASVNDLMSEEQEAAMRRDLESCHNEVSAAAAVLLVLLFHLLLPPLLLLCCCYHYHCCCYLILHHRCCCTCCHHCCCYLLF